MFTLLPNVTFKTVFQGTKQENKYVPGGRGNRDVNEKFVQNIVLRVLQNVPACQKISLACGETSLFQNLPPTMKNQVKEDTQW